MLTVPHIMRIIKPLSTKSKLEILSELSEDLKANFDTKPESQQEMLDKLFEGWNSDPVLSSDELIEDIYNSRTISDKKIFEE